MRTALLTLLLIAPAAGAADPPKIDGPAKVKPYCMVRLKAVNVDDHTAVVWRVKPADPATKVEYATPTNAPALVWIGPPGKYAVELIAVGAPDKDGRPALAIDELAVEIESPTPPPPPPAPPVPDSPLRTKLKSAFAQDAGDQATKDRVRGDLVALYRTAAKLAADASITSTSSLADRLRAAGGNLDPTGALIGLRKMIGGEVGAAFPSDAPLTPEARTAAATLFTSIADALAW